MLPWVLACRTSAPAASSAATLSAFPALRTMQASQAAGELATPPARLQQAEVLQHPQHGCSKQKSCNTLPEAASMRPARVARQPPVEGTWWGEQESRAAMPIPADG